MKVLVHIVRSIFVVAIVALMAMASPVVAHAADDQNAALKALKRGEILPYAKIKRKVEQSVGGQIVGSNLRRTNRGWQYDLRLRRKNGKVVVAIVDAKTGRILVTR